MPVHMHLRVCMHAHVLMCVCQCDVDPNPIFNTLPLLLVNSKQRKRGSLEMRLFVPVDTRDVRIMPALK